MLEQETEKSKTSYQNDTISSRQKTSRSITPKSDKKSNRTSSNQDSNSSTLSPRPIKQIKESDVNQFFVNDEDFQETFNDMIRMQQKKQLEEQIVKDVKKFLQQSPFQKFLDLTGEITKCLIQDKDREGIENIVYNLFNQTTKMQEQQDKQDFLLKQLKKLTESQEALDEKQVNLAFQLSKLKQDEEFLKLGKNALDEIILSVMKVLKHNEVPCVDNESIKDILKKLIDRNFELGEQQKNLVSIQAAKIQQIEQQLEMEVKNFQAQNLIITKVKKVLQNRELLIDEPLELIVERLIHQNKILGLEKSALIKELEQKEKVISESNEQRQQLLQKQSEFKSSDFVSLGKYQQQLIDSINLKAHNKELEQALLKYEKDINEYKQKNQQLIEEFNKIDDSFNMIKGECDSIGSEGKLSNFISYFGKLQKELDMLYQDREQLYHEVEIKNTTIQEFRNQQKEMIHIQTGLENQIKQKTQELHSNQEMMKHRVQNSEGRKIIKDQENQKLQIQKGSQQLQDEYSIYQIIVIDKNEIIEIEKGTQLILEPKQHDTPIILVTTASQIGCQEREVWFTTLKMIIINSFKTLSLMNKNGSNRMIRRSQTLQAQKDFNNILTEIKSQLVILKQKYRTSIGVAVPLKKLQRQSQCLFDHFTQLNEESQKEFFNNVSSIQ